MGIPERRLNNGPPGAEFAINIKNLRRVCKNTTGPAGPAGAAAKKRVTSRKNNSPAERKNVSAKRAVHQNRGPGWPLLEHERENTPATRSALDPTRSGRIAWRTLTDPGGIECRACAPATDRRRAARHRAARSRDSARRR